MHYPAKISAQLPVQGMAPALDHPLAADHYVANRLVRAGEYQAIQCRVRGGPGHRRMLVVQHQPIRAASDCDAAHPLTQRTRPVKRSVAPQPRADVRLGLCGKYRAALFAQALLILEPTQLPFNLRKRAASKKPSPKFASVLMDTQTVVPAATSPSSSAAVA
jgi:hypothetical protein